MEKKQFVEGPLTNVLKNARLGVERLELLEDGDAVRIIFDNGYAKKIDISADSYGSIIMDVTRAALY